MEENNNVEIKTQEVKEENCNCGCVCNKKNNKHGAFYWIVVIFGTAFIMIACYNIGYKLGKHFGDESNKSNSSSKSNVVSNSNKMTEDEKKEIAENLAKVFDDKDYKYGNVINANDISMIAQYILTGKFEEKYRAYLTLGSMEEKEVTLDPNNVDISDQDFKEALADIQVPVYKKEEFTNEFKKIYGTEPSYEDVKVGCPHYYYDKKGEQYIAHVACGGAGGIGVMVYIDDISKTDDDTVAITTYVGSYTTAPEGDEYFVDYYVLSAEPKKTTEKTITDKNKTSFTKYTITYKKASDGKYYYNTASKAN